MSEVRKIYLKHFLFREVLEYDLETGEYRLGEKPPEAIFADGFFRTVGGRIYGLRASFDGPIFFWEDKTVNLLGEGVTVGINDVARSYNKLFVLSVNSQPILELNFKPDWASDGFGLAPYEWSDFFYWLRDLLPAASFRSRFTAPPDTPLVSPEVQAILERLEKERKRDRPSQE